MVLFIWGGAEALLTSIVNHLNPEKYEVDIIEYYHAGIKTEPINKNINILPYIHSPKRLKGYFQTLQLYTCPKLITNQYIKRNYDLYVSFNYLVPTFLLPEGTKNIAWIHGDVYDLAEKKSLWKRKKQNTAFNNIQTIVAISDITEKSVRELFPQHKSKIIKLYNGIDTERIREKALDNTTIKLNTPSMLFIGRLEAGKDPIRLVRVLQLIHEKGIGAHLYFLGIGNEEDGIIDMAKKKDLSEFVHILGYQQNPFPVIKQCDVVCLLSKSEGFGLCLLEGLALDKPFVSTNVGAAEKMSNHQKCGRIVETDEQAAAAVCFFFDHDKSEIAKECHNSMKQFGLQFYIEQIENLFDRNM